MSHSYYIIALPRADPGLLTEFPLFPNFPVELQLKIWKMALPNSYNVITITDRGHFQNDYTKMNYGDWIRRAHSSYKIPAILHVNKQARIIAAQVLTPAFKYELGRAPVFFDFSRDVLHLNGYASIEAFFGPSGDFVPAVNKPRYTITGTAPSAPSTGGSYRHALLGVEEVMIQGFPAAEEQEYAAHLDFQWISENFYPRPHEPLKSKLCVRVLVPGHFKSVIEDFKVCGPWISTCFHG
jgi:hypothetical protein